MRISTDDYYAQLEAFYGHPDIASWQAVLGKALHYHNGLFPDGDEGLRKGARKAVESLYRYMPTGSSVLDAGCGWGGPLQMLAGEAGYAARGLTISRIQQAYCQSLGLDVIRGNMEELALNESFDRVLIMESAEHVRDKRGLFERLRPKVNGLVMRINCTNSLLNAMHAEVIEPGYMFLETPEMILHHLQRSGWRVKQVIDRRPMTMPTNEHWLRRIVDRYGAETPPGHIAVLKTLCEHALSQGDRWVEANPLLEIYAE